MSRQRARRSGVKRSAPRRPVKGGVVGIDRSSTDVTSLIDTNVLVYRYDARFPEKQNLATDLLRSGIEDNSIRVPYQAVLEFVAAVTKPLVACNPLLSSREARLEAEEFLLQFVVLYPNEETLRLALRGAAAYQLSWFDANLWAYAEYFGLQELVSEDYQHDRFYGTVRAVNPFLVLD